MRSVGSSDRGPLGAAVAFDRGQIETARATIGEGRMGFGTGQRTSNEVEALRELSTFPLVEALYGRRSRRFAFG